MNNRVYPTLRDAIFAASHGATPMKVIAPELDWSLSELSMHTTPGGPSARAFPFDEEHLVKMMRLTEDFSPLFTLAALCGYEVQPRRERLAEMVTGLNERLATIQSDMKQLSLVLNDERKKGGGR